MAKAKPVVHITRTAYDKLLDGLGKGFVPKFTETAGFVVGKRAGTGYDVTDAGKIPPEVLHTKQVQESKRLRYLFRPTGGEMDTQDMDDYLARIEKMKDVVGLYHQHPQSVPYPSRADKKDFKGQHKFEHIKGPSQLQLIPWSAFGLQRVAAYVERDGKYVKAKVEVDGKKDHPVMEFLVFLIEAVVLLLPEVV